MAALALLVSRLAGLTSLTTRLSARLVAEPMRYLPGKAFERKLLVYNLPYRRLALANDPEIVETVLIDRHSCFPKSAVVTTLLRPMIGAGVVGQQGGDAVRLARRLFIQALGKRSSFRASCRGSPSILSARSWWGTASAPRNPLASLICSLPITDVLHPCC